MGIARLLINLDGYSRWAAWYRVITLSIAAVCERVCAAFSAVSVVLFTLVGGKSTVGNLDLVLRAIGSS